MFASKSTGAWAGHEYDEVCAGLHGQKPITKTCLFNQYVLDQHGLNHESAKASCRIHGRSAKQSNDGDVSWHRADLFDSELLRGVHLSKPD